jgi:hypothetical protein
MLESNNSRAKDTKRTFSLMNLEYFQFAMIDGVSVIHSSLMGSLSVIKRLLISEPCSICYVHKFTHVKR